MAKTKTTSQLLAAVEKQAHTPGKRGRKKGSKNRPKSATSCTIDTSGAKKAISVVGSLISDIEHATGGKFLARATTAAGVAHHAGGGGKKRRAKKAGRRKARK